MVLHDARLYANALAHSDARDCGDCDQLPRSPGAAGRLLDSGFTYAAVFNIVGSLHVIAFVVILVTVPQIRALTAVSERERTVVS